MKPTPVVDLLKQVVLPFRIQSLPASRALDVSVHKGISMH